MVYSVENELRQIGALQIYIGNTNGKSWFFLVLSAFFVGYYKFNKQYFKAFIIICMSIGVSYLMLSRAAIVGGFILLIIFMFYIFNFKKIKNILLLVLFNLLLGISFLYFSETYSSSLVKKSLELKMKGRDSNRPNLVYEALEVSFKDYLLGRGFHYTYMHKDIFEKEGYQAISVNNTQNTLMSILIEIGILGVLLYSLFWVTLFILLVRFSKKIQDRNILNYLSGVKFMILFIGLTSLFGHYLEKSFVTMPIYMLIIALASRLVFEKKVGNI